MKYFNNCDLIEVSSLINDKYTFYDHLKGEGKETLKKHTDLVNKYLKKIVNAKNIDTIFKNYEENCLEDLSEEGKKVFRKLLINIFNFHDIGKINPNFQLRKMKNDIGNTEIFQDLHTKHSILSAILYIDYFMSDVEKLDKVSKNIIIEYLFLNAYVISRHHGGLNGFQKFLDRFSEDTGEEAKACIEIFLNNNID